MVWLTPDNGQGPVKLFQQQNPSHFMGKSQGRKRQLQIRLSQDIIRQTVRSPNQKDYPRPAAFKLSGKEIGKGMSGKRLAMLGEDNFKGIIPVHGLDQLRSLAAAKLPGGFLAPQAHFLQLPALDRQIAPQPLQVIINFSLPEAVPGFANEKENQAHTIIPSANSRRGASLQIPSRS